MSSTILLDPELTPIDPANDARSADADPSVDAGRPVDAKHPFLVGLWERARSLRARGAA